MYWGQELWKSVNHQRGQYPIDQKWRKFMYDHGLGNPRWRLPSKIIIKLIKIKVLRDCQVEGSYAFQETIRKWVKKNQRKNSNNWQ
jgi:hypothetical protein